MQRAKTMKLGHALDRVNVTLADGFPIFPAVDIDAVGLHAGAPGHDQSPIAIWMT